MILNPWFSPFFFFFTFLFLFEDSPILRYKCALKCHGFGEVLSSAKKGEKKLKWPSGHKISKQRRLWNTSLYSTFLHKSSATLFINFNKIGGFNHKKPSRNSNRNRLCLLIECNNAYSVSFHSTELTEEMAKV